MYKISTGIALALTLGLSGEATQAALVGTFMDSFTFEDVQSYADKDNENNTVRTGNSLASVPYRVSSVRWYGEVKRGAAVDFTLIEDLAATLAMGESGPNVDLKLGGTCNFTTLEGCNEIDASTASDVSGSANGDALGDLLGAKVSQGQTFRFTFFELFSDAGLTGVEPPDAIWNSITFEIEGTLVPIPAALWLFVPALAGLAAFRRRRVA